MLTNTTHHRSRIVAVGVAVAIAVASLLPGAWGTAVAQTAGEVQVTFTVNGTTTTVATTPDNFAAITIPPGATITGLSVFTADATSLGAVVNAAQGGANALASFLGVDVADLGYRGGVVTGQYTVSRWHGAHQGKRSAEFHNTHQQPDRRS